MTRPSKFLLICVVVVFLLACDLVSQPVKDAENLAKTAEALGSAIPFETLKALPSSVPIETLQALGSAVPNVENVFNPQGTPVKQWKDIPIMPQATAGEEFARSNAYSFKAPVTFKQVEDFYKGKLASLGWKQPYDAAVEGDAGLLVFQKGKSTLTIMVTSSEDSSVVVLAIVET